MQESFNKWFFSKRDVEETKEKIVIKEEKPKKKSQKYVNRRIMRICR